MRQRHSRPRTRSRPTPERDGPRAYVRQAGELDLEDGARLSWSVADGSRGRRWRAVSLVGGTISHALLLELNLAGRPARLELTTAAGMLTLHPSLDRSELHGNIVRPGRGGVEHLAMAWGDDLEIDVLGRPLAIAAGLHRRRAAVPVGGSASFEVVAVGPGLEIARAERRAERASVGDWLVFDPADGPARRLSLDADGLPVNGARWALERG
jgi:hypothetical protein